jgi:hypothetical protein
MPDDAILDIRLLGRASGAITRLPDGPKHLLVRPFIRR